MPPEVLDFIKSAEGAAALEAPLDDGAGKQAVKMMRQAENAASSVDVVKLAASAPYGVPLRGAHVLELGPGEGHGTRALLAYEPATVTAVDLDRAQWGCIEPSRECRQAHPRLPQPCA